jgi:hypothetical protein
VQREEIVEILRRDTACSGGAGSGCHRVRATSRGSASGRITRPIDC